MTGVMSVEHVRVWQRPGAINVGCDPSAVTANGESFRTAEYISCNRDLYVPESEQGQWRFTYCSAFQSQVGGVTQWAAQRQAVGLLQPLQHSVVSTLFVPPPRL